MDNYDLEVFQLKDKTKYLLKFNNTKALVSISSALNVFSDKYFFNPKYKMGIWDGKISFIKNDKIPVGLLSRVLTVCKNMQLQAKIHFKNPLVSISNNENDNVNNQKVIDFIDELNLPFYPRYYQINALVNSIRNKVHGIQSITSSGKSLIIYMICRKMIQLNKTVLLIVPRKSLVTQMYNDFVKYNFDNAEDYCHLIKAGVEKNLKLKPITISTWQSIFKLDESYYNNIDCVIVDEAHGAKATSISTIINNCYTADYRIGLSGTFPKDNTAATLEVEGAFGKFVEYLTYKEANERGWISPSKINAIFLQYNKSDCETVSSFAYHDEINFIQNHTKRNNFIANFCSKLQNNTIVMFSQNENHGMLLFEIFKNQIASNKKTILYMDGSTKDKNRLEIFNLIEQRHDIILLVNFGVFAEGISLNNIHNIIFVSSYKSETKVIQSIGRGLRLYPDKKMNLYDIVDCLMVNRNKNYMMKHFQERLKLYNERDFVIEKQIINLT